MSGYTPYLDTYLEPIPTPEYECGKVFPDREITNKELKHTFAPGEIVESKNGDTRYEIISATEQNGTLSGQFFMIMDCWGGAKIRCEFSKTQINTDNIVLKTIFHSVTDSTLYIKPETIRKEVEQAFFDAATVLTDFSIKDTVKIDKPYTYLYINESGKVVAVSVNNNGKTEEKTTEISATNLKENTLIQGKNGEELVLTKKGQVMGKTEFNATGGNSVLLKEYHRKSDSLAQWQINFSKYDAQTYAFDHIGSGNHGIFSSSEYYPQVGSYDFRYKSVECGKKDKVIVEFGSYPQVDSVVFKDKYGVTYPISLKDNVLSFTGVSKADTNFIYAYRGDQKIGKLFLNTYKRQTKYIELVSVNGGTIDKTITAEGLNQIFKGAVVNFKIEIKSLDIHGLKTFTHGGSNWHSVYNDDQKKVLEAYDSLMKDDKFYLFFVDNVLNKKDSLGTSVSGYMPSGYNAGFIYEGGSLHTVAHELGHGIGNLEHVFENSSNSGKTKNLMDYSFEKDAEQLWHFQWDQIQDPSRVWMKWNKAEEEGENVEGKKPSVEFIMMKDVRVDSKKGNRYGFDAMADMDKKNDRIAHISVCKIGTTYLKVDCNSITLNEVSFVSNGKVMDFEIEDKNTLKIEGKLFGENSEYIIDAIPSSCIDDKWNEKKLTDRNIIIKDNSLGSIYINVYDIYKISKTIYYKEGELTPLDIDNLKDISSKYLKYLVAEQNYTFEKSDKNMDVDANKNGRIEHICNNSKSINNEYEKLTRLIENNAIVLLKNVVIYDCWELAGNVSKNKNIIRISNFSSEDYKKLKIKHQSEENSLTIYDPINPNYHEEFYIKDIVVKSLGFEPIQISYKITSSPETYVLNDLLSDEILSKVEKDSDGRVYFTLKNEIYNSDKYKPAMDLNKIPPEGPHFYSDVYRSDDSDNDTKRKLSNGGRMNLPLLKRASGDIYLIANKKFTYSYSTSAYITDEKNSTLGFSHINPEKGVVVCLQKDHLEYTGEVLLHEIMHSIKPEVFFDVNEEGNIMHYTASKYTDNSKTQVEHIQIKVPFRYKPLPKKDDSSKKQSQWQFRY